MKIKLLIFAMLIGLSASAQFKNRNQYGLQSQDGNTDSVRLVWSTVGGYSYLPTTKMLRAAIAGVTPISYTNGYGLSLVGQQFRVDTSAIASKTFANTKVNKVQKIIYVDDFADTGTGINSAFRKAYNSVDSNAILIFSAKRYKFPNFTQSDYISKPGITLQGSGMGYNSENARRLNGGTIIEGGIYVYADNFTVKDLGFDGGQDWSDASANVDGQVLIFVQPNSTAPFKQMKNVRVENVYCLGTSGLATGHAALFENINGLYVNNLWASYVSHGIVFKSENVFASNLHSYAHNGDNVLVKSDDYAKANKIYISNVFVSKYIPNTPSQWDIPVMNDGVSIKAIGADLANITVENASIEWANFAFTVAGDPGRNVSTVTGNNIVTNISQYGMSLIGGNNFDNVRFGDVTISNSTQYGVVSSTPNAANHTTIQNLKIYNATQQGTGVLLVGNANMRIDNIEGNSNVNRYSVVTGTLLTIGNETGAGNANIFASGSNTAALNYLYPSPLGVRASGTWGINISGTSANSTLWNGQAYSPTPNTNPAFFVSAAAGDAAFSYANVADTKTALGINNGSALNNVASSAITANNWSGQPADFSIRATSISSVPVFNSTDGKANYALSSDLANFIGLGNYQTVSNLSSTISASTTLYPNNNAIISYTTGNFVKQGGNSFGAAMVIGTNDAQDVKIKRNGIEMVQITSTVTMPFGVQASVNNGGANDLVRNVDLNASANEIVLSKTANYTITQSDLSNVNTTVLYANAASGNITITLPSVAISTGRKIIVFKTDATANTVTITGAANINGSTTYTVTPQYSSVEIHANGTQYYAK